jgi:hypothetical protein
VSKARSGEEWRQADAVASAVRIDSAGWGTGLVAQAQLALARLQSTVWVEEAIMMVVVGGCQWR